MNPEGGDHAVLSRNPHKKRQLFPMITERNIKLPVKAFSLHPFHTDSFPSTNTPLERF